MKTTTKCSGGLFVIRHKDETMWVDQSFMFKKEAKEYRAQQGLDKADWHISRGTTHRLGASNSHFNHGA